jgi:hypothetical protein
MKAVLRRVTDVFDVEERWLVLWVVPAVLLWTVVAFLV